MPTRVHAFVACAPGKASPKAGRRRVIGRTFGLSDKEEGGRIAEALFEASARGTQTEATGHAEETTGPEAGRSQAPGAILCMSRERD